MAELESAAWPPAPIRTERLVLRESEARDRAAFVELLASAEVHTYLGGARPRDELENAMSEVPGQSPGIFVVELDGAMIGTVELKRYEYEGAEDLRAYVGTAELGYLLMPEAWGRGYGAEACAAALDWFTGECPGEPVVLCTQTANERSMRLAAKLGFTEAGRYEAYGAKQWLGMWSPAAPSS